MANAAPDARCATYIDPRFDRPVFRIQPGEYFATTRPVIIATVLGSCVAACIRDPIRGGAGMNHFLLPEQGADSRAAGESGLRYGAFAMEKLINEFVKRGSARNDLEAKVFGGAAVVDAIRSDIGAQNAKFVIDYLAIEGIRTTAMDLGGTAPRRVLFFVEDGRVLVKYLGDAPTTIGQREAALAHQLALESRPIPVELF